jgi:hypothetical protein
MIYSVLSYLAVPLLLVVMAMMIYRRLYREFPFFFSYIVVVVLVEVVRFALFHLRMPNPYFYIYWITEAAEVLLGFLVVYEVFLIRLFPGFKITVIYRRLFPAMGVIVTALTIWIFLSLPSTGPSRIVTLIGSATLALNFCQVSFLIFFAGLALYMEREPGPYEVGIGVGFGIHAAVKLFATGQGVGHAYAPTWVYQLPTISYLVAILIWLYFLVQSVPEPEETPITQEMLDQAEKAYGEVVHLLWRDPRKR